MAGTTDRGGSGWGRSRFGLGQFDLNVADAGHRQQGLARLGGDAVALAAGETGQGELEHRPGVLAPQPADPAQLQQAAAAAGILQGGQGSGKGIPSAGRIPGIGSLVWGGHPVLEFLRKG
jgi:hypothetical protein